MGQIIKLYILCARAQSQNSDIPNKVSRPIFTCTRLAWFVRRNLYIGEEELTRTAHLFLVPIDAQLRCQAKAMHYARSG